VAKTIPFFFEENMSQHKTANYIVAKAFQKIKLFSEDEVLAGNKYQDGFEELNDIVSQAYDDSLFIPSPTVLNFPLIAGKREYKISKKGGADVDHNPFSSVDFARLNDSGTMYQISVEDRFKFYSTGRTDVENRPSKIFWTKGVDETIINFFTIPDGVYDFYIEGFSILPQFEPDVTLETIPDSYITYLVYALGRNLSDNFEAADWSVKLELAYKDALRKLKFGRKKSLVIRKNRVLRFRRCAIR
jgi:hypothetical protein